MKNTRSRLAVDGLSMAFAEAFDVPFLPRQVPAGLCCWLAALQGSILPLPVEMALQRAEIPVLVLPFYLLTLASTFQLPLDVRDCCSVKHRGSDTAPLASDTAVRL